MFIGTGRNDDEGEGDTKAQRGCGWGYSERVTYIVTRYWPISHFAV